jgi:hypothetical protein
MKAEVKLALVAFIIILGACVLHSIEHKPELFRYWLLLTIIPLGIYLIGLGIRNNVFNGGGSDGYY